MRVDHIENLNRACESIAELAAEALAEHDRQIAELRAIVRKAKAVTEKQTESTEFVEKPAAVTVGGVAAAVSARKHQSVKKISPFAKPASQPASGRYPFAMSRDATPSDILRLAMLRAEDHPLLPGIKESEPANSDDGFRPRRVTSLSDIAFRLAASL
jgi:hypothetical protein